MTPTSPANIVLRLHADEILDSRGVPTIEVTIALSGSSGEEVATASVPSGKSTGRNEALERRDGDPARFGGKGVLGAVSAVRGEIAKALVGQPLPTQQELDRHLVQLDGTPNKSRLGANAILGTSLAAARARSQVAGVRLFESLATELGREEPTLLPVPCFNVINGGAHAPNALDFQEFMLAPAGRPTFAEALRAGAECYHALAAILDARGLSTAVGDEGGFAPAIEKPTEALDLLVEAIERAGYRPGEDVFIALDPAASGFSSGGIYRFAGEEADAAAMAVMYATWLGHYPIISIEDGLAEDDIDGWIHLTREIGGRVQLVGDDTLVSDASRVRDAIARRIGNAVLLKPNQIGTLAEIDATARVAREGGFRAMMSHRSGETNDAFVADLAVAFGTGQIKAGAPARGERVAKYNELSRIERYLGRRARFAGKAGFARPT